MTRLKRYLPFTKGVVLEALTYRFRFIFWVTFEILYLVIAYFLWRGVYQSHASSYGIPIDEVVIGGYTLATMIMYVFCEKIIGNLTYVDCSDFIANDIRDGSIAMRLIKPLSYRKQLFFQGIGNLVISFFVFAIPFIIILFGCSFFIDINININFPSAIMLAISILLGGIISYFVSFLFGMILFLTINSFGMWQLRSALERILSGALIPISLFPNWLKVICDFVPFAQTRFVPICFAIGKYNDDVWGGILALGIQLAWIVGLAILSKLLWNRATKRIIVQGG